MHASSEPAQAVAARIAVLDWHRSRVLAHSVSITMEADFCVEALREATALYGTPEIDNT